MDVELRSLELGPFLHSVTTAFTSAERERIVVDSEIHAMVCDERKLYRILANLVENAVKYAPTGLIDVAAAAADDGWMSFVVADRGPGIAAVDRERVFERFVQLDQSSKRTRGGTGLGLHLCRQLAHLLGGSLQASERDGGGTEFTLRLPMSSPTPEPDDGDPSCEGTVAGGVPSEAPDGWQPPPDHPAPAVTPLSVPA